LTANENTCSVINPDSDILGWLGMVVDLAAEWLAQLEAELAARQRQQAQIERIEERAAEELIERHAAIAQRLAAYPRSGHMNLPTSWRALLIGLRSTPSA
jgi:hypothetical protein